MQFFVYLLLCLIAGNDFKFWFEIIYFYAMHPDKLYICIALSLHTFHTQTFILPDTIIVLTRLYLFLHLYNHPFTLIFIQLISRLRLEQISIGAFPAVFGGTA